jgi:hypothetical protein
MSGLYNENFSSVEKVSGRESQGVSRQDGLAVNRQLQSNFDFELLIVRNIGQGEARY